MDTGSSQRTFPSSTSMASAVAVNALVVEAMANEVCSSTRSFPPTVLTPKPRAYTTESSLTMAMAIPGTCQSRMAPWTYASNPSSGRPCAAAGAAATTAAATTSARRTIEVGKARMATRQWRGNRRRDG